MTHSASQSNNQINPRSAYPSPEYLAQSDLSHAQKLRLLERWKADEEALMRATGEGMGGGQPTMIARVERALESLRASKD
jgi:hypothetical protein